MIHKTLQQMLRALIRYTGHQGGLAAIVFALTMPMIISSDDEAFTNSVLLAITEWRFAVPKHVGRPVIARVRQKFTFSPTS